MSLILNAQNLEKSFGSDPLFHNLSLSVFSKNRIGLIGPNGSGKTTLLKILAGIESPDKGEVALKNGVRIGYVSQSQDFPDISPFKLILEKASCEHLAKTWLSKLGFTGQEKCAKTLSGGWKKRLAIALELVKTPDLLLLDEPTNHLDLQSVLWLDTFLQREAPTFILVSHDRYFLQKMTNRTIEINSVYPSGILSIEGTFEHFSEKKELFLKGQLQQQSSTASKTRKEIHWMRQSPKARTTKSRARLDQAKDLVNELADLKKRNQRQVADIEFDASKRQTRKLLIAKNISYASFINKLDIALHSGTRLGLIGPNGSGKTTLLRLLAGELQPDEGTIKQADELKIVYFDQHRAQIPLNLTLKEALSPNGDYVHFQGKPIHINGWCKRFLFSPSSLNQTLSYLSGGERARITIARLMLQPADILLLDEPTNDLDIPTLEMLEKNLIEFPGAVVLITHDRSLIEKTCNQFLSIEDSTYFSHLSQWKNHQNKQKSPTKKIAKPLPSYKEKKEIERIEKQITKQEKALEALQGSLTSTDDETLHSVCEKIALLQSEIEKLYIDWENFL